MAVRKINNSWWVDIRHNYVRFRKKSPDDSKAGAQAYEALLRQKLARGEALENDEQQKEQKQKFKVFAWHWFETHVKIYNKHSDRSHKMYVLRSNLIPFFGETPINEINTYQIEKYKASKKGKVSDKTINNHLIVLSSCLSAASEWFGIPKVKIKKLKVSPQKVDFLTPEESNALLTNLDGIWKEITITALKTGLRIGELKGLNWADIIWNNRTLTVQHSWCEYKKGLSSPKSNKVRHIPLTDELFTMLMNRKRATGFVFMDKRGVRFSSNSLNDELAKACKAAEMRQITCHTLRHTFASHLVMAGASLKEIQELLGHANIQTTMRYAHLAPSSLRKAIGLLGSIDGVSADFGHYVGTNTNQKVEIIVNEKTAK